MRDVLDTLTRWASAGTPVAVATVVGVERSAPRGPGATMAVSAAGEIVGSVTGGCVEPALVGEAEEVLAGGPARVVEYGIADEEAFEVGIPCGGRVRILVWPLDADLVAGLERAVAEERHVAAVLDLTGPAIGRAELVEHGAATGELGRRIARDANGAVHDGERERLAVVLAPRPRMLVFGAIDFSAALARLGTMMGYRVTVCDARGAFVTRERFPTADELVVEWPHVLIARTPVDERTAICVLTHDQKFDVPALKAALATPAGYVGAMGSRVTTERRAARLRAEGVSENELARIHAPIGLSIGAKTPEEVAVAVMAQIIETRRVEAAQRVAA